jgi:trk system potassium uptake protein TrkA
MRVIVIGLGEVGQHIGRTLSAERHDVTIVDRDAARVEAMQGELDAMVLAGNGASPRFLGEIGAGEADLLCAVTQSDEANVIAALAARQLGAKRTVARVRDPDYFGGDESFSRDMLGIDFVIHPERATAEDLAEAVLLPGAVHVEHFADGRVTVAESILTDRSPLIGHALRERGMVRPHSIFGIIRDGRTLAAEPGYRPKRGDHVLVAAARDEMGATIAHVAGRASDVGDVVIFGAGRIGLPLARHLEAVGGVRITVMERDPERARYVAERLRAAMVLHEEGVGKDALLAHGVDRAGAFVASAGDDRSNLLAALHAKQVGADLSVAVVSREEFVPLVDALGIDAAFSPRLVTAEAILRAVMGEHVRAMHLLVGGAELLEVEAEAGCRAEGRTIEQVDSMAWTHVAAVVRDGRVLMPDPAERILAGDRVLVFSPRRGVQDVRRTFTAA